MYIRLNVIHIYLKEKFETTKVELTSHKS